MLDSPNLTPRRIDTSGSSKSGEIKLMNLDFSGEQERVKERERPNRRGSEGECTTRASPPSRSRARRGSRRGPLAAGPQGERERSKAGVRESGASITAVRASPPSRARAQKGSARAQGGERGVRGAELEGASGVGGTELD